MKYIIILVSIIVILLAICIWQRLVIKGHRQDFDIVQHRVWMLQDKYNINDEDITNCFRP